MSFQRQLCSVAKRKPTASQAVSGLSHKNVQPRSIKNVQKSFPCSCGRRHGHAFANRFSLCARQSTLFSFLLVVLGLSLCNGVLLFIRTEFFFVLAPIRAGRGSGQLVSLLPLSFGVHFISVFLVPPPALRYAEHHGGRA